MACKLVALLSGSFLCLSSALGLDFGSYPATVQSDECKSPVFSSFSRARNSEEMIRKNNKNLKKANFGGNYLLLEVPFMMGSDWLILDCKTGLFLKEVLKGKAEFKPDSYLLRVSDATQSEWKLWTGSTFVRVDDSIKTGNAPSDPSLQTRYSGVMGDHPTQVSTRACAPLKPSSYFRAQSAETELKKASAHFLKPNFSGDFLLIRVELLFETLWLIASCETGLFFPEFLSGELFFLPSSSIAVLTRTGKSPELYAWNSNKWIRRPDPTVNEGPWIRNEIHGAEARGFAKLLPNPNHHSKIEFEDLTCRSQKGWECTFKNQEKRIPLLSPPSQAQLQMLRTHGKTQRTDSEVLIQIDRGACSPEKSECFLEVK